MSTTFNQRSWDMYATLKKRGPVRFTLSSFRAHLERAIGRDPYCPYCKVLLMLKNVSADHKTPVARGGRNLLGNISFVCKSCNKAKGDWTDEEFSYLLTLLDSMDEKYPEARGKLRVRSALMISHSFRQGLKWRAKKAAKTES